MKIALLSLLAAFVLCLGGALPATAYYSNDPVVFSQIQNKVLQPVDYLTWCGDCLFTDYTAGTPWVVNPGTYWPFALSLPPTPVSSMPGCMWDSDDAYEWDSHGNILAAGASAGITECLYLTTNYSQHGESDVWIISPSPKLVVTQTWTWDTGSVTATITPTWSATYKAWQYFDCFYAPPPLNGTLVTVPGSNGGQAVPVLVTATISNPTKLKVGKTGGVFDGGNINGISRGPGCGSIGWWHYP